MWKHSRVVLGFVVVLGMVLMGGGVLLFAHAMANMRNASDDISGTVVIANAVSTIIDLRRHPHRWGL